MTEAILATFSDVKFIRTRSTMQLILELPIERADSSLKALGGVPQPGTERWVGVILAPTEDEAVSKLVGDFVKMQKSSKEHRPLNSLPLSQQAGLRCNDYQFIRYLEEMYPDTACSVPAADLVRELCGITSRSELDTNDIAAQKWRKLESDFQAYKTDLMYSGQIK